MGNDKNKEWNFYNKNNNPNNLFTNKRLADGDNLNFSFKNSRQIGFHCNQLLYETGVSGIDFLSEKNRFKATNFNDLMTIRRRKRRKFATEEERRVARILKNRRTAEESRQRRIQKMKTLENFVSNSEEREKRFKDEIRIIGIQSALKMVELITLRKYLVPQISEI